MKESHDNAFDSFEGKVYEWRRWKLFGKGTKLWDGKFCNNVFANGKKMSEKEIFQEAVEAYYDTKNLKAI